MFIKGDRVETTYRRREERLIRLGTVHEVRSTGKGPFVSVYLDAAPGVAQSFRPINVRKV